jgi:polyisoprenoid-binding protein YceI
MIAHRRILIFTLSFGMILSTSTTSLGDASIRAQIDPARSRATFTVTHALIENVPGTIPIVSGDIVIGSDGIPLQISAVLDPTRIDTGNPDRDGDLQSGDWFDTADYPTISFVSTRVTSSGDRAFSVNGDLTIHGVTRPVTLSCTDKTAASDQLAPGQYRYSATVQIERHDFMPARARADVLVGKTVSITLDVVTSAPSAVSQPISGRK